MTGNVVDARSGLELLDREECLRRVRSCAIGRIAVVSDGAPFVVPVNFTLDGDAVVLRTDAGTMLHAALGGPVAFECDAVDRQYHTGWSVVIAGVAEEVRDPAEIGRLARLPLGPWCPGPAPVWLRIRPGAVTGRRIPLHGMHRD